MKTQEHTAGPWTIDYMGRESWIGSQTDQDLVAHVETVLPNYRANACLIAAAPQLLEALGAADRLLTQCLTVLHDKAIADRIPFGLLDEVKHFVIKNVGTNAVRSAKGETL